MTTEVVDMITVVVDGFEVSVPKRLLARFQLSLE